MVLGTPGSGKTTAIVVLIQILAKLKKRADNLIKLIKVRTGIKIDIWAAASIKKLLDKLEIKDYKETPKSKMPQLPKDYLKTHKNRF